MVVHLLLPLMFCRTLFLHYNHQGLVLTVYDVQYMLLGKRDIVS